MSRSVAPFGLRFAPHAAVFSVGYVMFAYAAVPGAITARYGVGLAAFGLLMTAPLLAFVLVQGPVGWATDRRSTTELLLALVVVHAALAVALDFAGSFAALLAGRFAWGLIGGAILSVGATHVARLSTGDRSTRQQGLYGGLLTLGGATGFLLAPAVATEPIGLHALGVLACLPATAALLRHRGAGRTRPIAGDGAAATSTLSVLSHPAVLVAALCYLATMGSYVTLSTFVTAYFEELGILGPLNAAVLAMASTGRIVGGEIGGRGLADRPLIAIGTGLGAAGFLALGLSPGRTLVVVLPLVTMLAISIPFGAIYTVAAGATDAEGSAIAAVVAAGNVAALSLPPITGALREATGGYREAFGLLAALNAIAALGVVLLATQLTQTTDR